MTCYTNELTGCCVMASTTTNGNGVINGLPKQIASQWRLYGQLNRLDGGLFMFGLMSVKHSLGSNILDQSMGLSRMMRKVCLSWPQSNVDDAEALTTSR